MNRYARLLSAAVLVGALAACASPADDPPASTSPEPMGSMPPASAPMERRTVEPSPAASDDAGSGGMGGMDHGGEEVEVRIDNFAFVDETIEVSVGTTVTWVNGDSARHTVTSGTDDTADGTFDGDLPGGETFSFTFEEPGEYAYFCDIHPTMTGVVIVTP